MGQIKGILLIPWIKSVRADKTGRFDKLLTEAERKIVDSQVYPSSWYPFEVYAKIIDMIANEYAKYDEETIYNWGYDSAGLALATLKGTFLEENSPQKTMKLYMVLTKTFLDFGSMEATVGDNNHLTVNVSGFPPELKAFYYVLRGWLARILALAKARDIKSRFVEKTWRGAPNTIIEYSWS